MYSRTKAGRDELDFTYAVSLVPQLYKKQRPRETSTSLTYRTSGANETLPLELC